MNIENVIRQKAYEYPKDYVVEGVQEKRAQNILNSVGISCIVTNIFQERYDSLGLNLNSVTLVYDVIKGDEDINVILKCQNKEPTQDDLYWLFHSVSSLFLIKHHKVELYVLCLEEVKEKIRKITLNEDSEYIIHVISLKSFKAEEIFNNIENKLNSDGEITEEDIALLQLIAYTDYDDSPSEVLKYSALLLDKICTRDYDINEKMELFYYFDVLSVNMLDDDEYEKYRDATKMLFPIKDTI